MPELPEFSNCTLMSDIWFVKSLLCRESMMARASAYVFVVKAMWMGRHMM